MKIKRFTAKDMRSALRNVSDTMGPDAVILSNTRVSEGIEIVAAIDYDESLINESEDSSALPSTTAKKPNPFIEDEKITTGSKSTFAQKRELTPTEQRNRSAALDDIRFARNIPAPTPEPGLKAKTPDESSQPKVSEHLWT